MRPGSVRTEITEKGPRQMEYSPLARRLMTLIVSPSVKRQDAGEKLVVGRGGRLLRPWRYEGEDSYDLAPVWWSRQT